MLPIPFGGIVGHVHPAKITFGEMRAAGVRWVLIYWSDYRCSHSTAISGDRWADDVRLSDPRRGSPAKLAAGAAPMSKLPFKLGYERFYAPDRQLVRRISRKQTIFHDLHFKTSAIPADVIPASLAIR
ncbi:MAG TPA: hypothetical protein VN345_15805 [Blastocatellia bacterium]|nr:hypothetical protein [Blastocatellia bacterium]